MELSLAGRRGASRSFSGDRGFGGNGLLSHGGTLVAANQVQRMLDLVPTDIHERCPVILGSPRDVNKVLEMYKAAPVS